MVSINKSATCNGPTRYGHPKYYYLTWTTCNGGGWDSREKLILSAKLKRNLRLSSLQSSVDEIRLVVGII